MKDLSFSTKLYLAIIYLLGFGLLLWNAPNIPANNYLMVITLSLLASVFQVFKVQGATVRSHYSFSFLIYGFSFAYFGLSETMVVILTSHLVEWVWKRPTWYIVIFNISCYFIAISATDLIFKLIASSASLLTPLGILAIVICMGAFTLLNHFVVGIILWLARGENFKVSGIFDIFPILMDLTFLTFGAMLDLVWNANPYAMILILFPLYLIYMTLRIPELERQTETDPKTGLFNLKFFKQQFTKELDRANRFDRPLAIIMLDLDLLRNINNTYGHLAGDEVLLGIARILKQSIREYDVVARFGGEEFSIMLPETTLQQSLERAEIIRRAIDGAEFTISTSVTPIKVTISIGISERESFSQTTDEIIHNADTALYHSKLNGRNRSTAYTSDAYVDFLGRKAEVGSLPNEQSKIELQKEPVKEASDGYSAANAKYSNTQPAPPLTEEVITKVQKLQSKTAGKTSTHSGTPVLIYIFGLAMLAILFSFGLYQFTPELYQVNWIKVWPGLLTCITLVVLTESYSIDLYIGKTSLSTSAVPILAGTLLFGLPAGIILSGTYAVVVGIKYRSKFNKYIFNFCNQAIAVMLYTHLLFLSGWSIDNFSLGLQALFVVFASLVVYVLNTIFISTGMGIDLHESPYQIWKEQYSWLLTIYIAIGLIATAFILGYHEAGVLGTLLMMVPLFLLRISQKQYVDRTREAVTELREKNIILEKNAEEINQLNDGLLDTLAEIIDLRDPYVLGHSKRVTSYATKIAERMGLNPKQVELIRKGSLLHDVGKLGISMDILAKPEPLTGLEYETVKMHTEFGSRILGINPSLRLLIPIVRHHHEFYNGKGYPDGTSGHQIPIEARVVSIADAIEAMASDRPYRKARTTQYILNELKKFSGTQFDPKVVEHAIKLIESEEFDEASVLSIKNAFAAGALGNQQI